MLMSQVGTVREVVFT